MLVDIFQTAHLNPTSVFLALGSGAGRAMICASGLKPRLVLGLEVSLSRVATSVREVLESKMSTPIYPIHACIEEVSYYDPASHVFCFMEGMSSPVISAIRCAILRSASVITIAQKTTASVGSSATHRLHVYKRLTQPRGGKCHPIFYLPVYWTHFSTCWPLVLRSYLLSLEVEPYERHYCRGSLVESRNVEMKNSSLPPHYLVASSHASIGLLSTFQQCQGNTRQVSATTRVKNRDRPAEFITSSPQLTQHCTVDASATCSCTATVRRNGVSASSYVHAILRLSNEMIVSINEYNDRAVYNIAAMSNDEIIAMIKDATCTPWTPTKETHVTYHDADMDAVWNVARDLHLDKHDVFIDIGAGKGRLVMLLAIKMDLNCHIGIEIDHDRQQVVVKAKQTLVGEDVPSRTNIFIKNKDLFNCEHVSSDSGSARAYNGRFKQETNELIKNLLVSNLSTMYLVVTEDFSSQPSDSHPLQDDFMSLPPVDVISIDSSLSQTVSPSSSASDEPWNARTNANVLNETPTRRIVRRLHQAEPLQSPKRCRVPESAPTLNSNAKHDKPSPTTSPLVEELPSPAHERIKIEHSPIPAREVEERRSERESPTPATAEASGSLQPDDLEDNQDTPQPRKTTESMNHDGKNEGNTAETIRKAQRTVPRPRKATPRKWKFPAGPSRDLWLRWFHGDPADEDRGPYRLLECTKSQIARDAKMLMETMVDVAIQHGLTQSDEALAALPTPKLLAVFDKIFPQLVGTATNDSVMQAPGFQGLEYEELLEMDFRSVLRRLQHGKQKTMRKSVASP
ncbi:hypothetical protein AC1031_018131 [Aphanomyces cochlioides]|nr:hypothetical protein AC1031_018131 [Aphanomyces cochlioides]